MYPYNRCHVSQRPNVWGMFRTSSSYQPIKMIDQCFIVAASSSIADISVRSLIFLESAVSVLWHVLMYDIPPGCYFMWEGVICEYADESKVGYWPVVWFSFNDPITNFLINHVSCLRRARSKCNVSWRYLVIYKASVFLHGCFPISGQQKAEAIMLKMRSDNV